MPTLEDIKALLSRDICDWCKPYTERGEDCFGCPKGDRDAMCKAAKEARAQDVYERFVYPLEKKVNLLSMWTETYANYGVEMKDAAEFEARVAKRSVKNGSMCISMVLDHKCSHPGHECCECYLRDARLAVEAEMEAEGK